MNNYHITKSKSGNGWDLKKEGGERATLKAETKAELVKATSQLLQDKGGSVKIHKGNGQIQEERTYPRSADPKKTPG